MQKLLSPPVPYVVLAMLLLVMGVEVVVGVVGYVTSEDSVAPWLGAMVDGSRGGYTGGATAADGINC